MCSQRVGVGGGAVVIRARDRQLHRFVAVKVLRSREADLRTRFVHESVVLAGIDHPAIVRVLAHDSDGDELYTVLELPTGAERPRPTSMGTALGTPGYLPLEAGLVDPNPSFDVFGLGATLYQLLMGKLPRVPLQALREAHPGCDAPDDLGLVLAAALALEPEDRTQSAAELGRALAAVLAAHPERGTPSKRIDGRYELIGLVGTGAKADAHIAAPTTTSS